MGRSMKLPFHCKPRTPRKAPSVFEFMWDAERKHSGVEVSDNGLEVSTQRNTGWQSIFGDTLIPEKGVYEWFIRLNGYSTSNSYNVVISVVPASFKNWTHGTLSGYNS